MTCVECDRPVLARQRCDRHYRLHLTRIRPTSLCAVGGCEKHAYRRSWCAMHYERWKKYGDPSGGSTFWGEPHRFLDEAVVYEGTGCLIWPFKRTSRVEGKGYGSVHIDGVIRQAHRVVLERVQGPPPTPNHEAAHAPVVCHNRLCVNPAHLRWATPSENSSDRWLDGTHNRHRKTPFTPQPGTNGSTQETPSNPGETQ